MKVKKSTLVIGFFALTGLSAVSLNATAASEVTLQGSVTKTTCSVGVNGGKSVLNVGSFQSTQFDAANKKVGSVPLPITLTACDAAAEEGQLIIQGLTSSRSADQTIFVSNNQDTVGFVVTEADGINPVSNGKGPKVTLSKDQTSSQYIFNVSMASATNIATVGAYSAPILISYLVD